MQGATFVDVLTGFGIMIPTVFGVRIVLRWIWRI